MKKSQRGATLLEVVAVLVVIVVIVAIIAGAMREFIGNMTGMNYDTAMQEARAWAETMKIKAEGVECAHTDSDGDGYVSCTISSHNPNGSLELTPVECAISLSFNSGCRSQKLGNLNNPR